MSAFSTLLALINAQIKTNGLKAITGAKLNGVLVQMVNELGSGYQFIDIATPATDPGTPDENVFYIATTPGNYTNFGGLAISDGEVAIFKGTGSTWTKEVTGAATAAQVSQLGQDVSDIDFALGLNTKVAQLTLDVGSLYQGSIDHGTKFVLCSTNYIKVFPNVTLKLIHDSDITIRVAEYSENKTYIRDSGAYSNINSLLLGNTTRYIRIAGNYSAKGYSNTNPVTIEDYTDGDFGVYIPEITNIDEKPTSGSEQPAKSGGIFDFVTEREHLNICVGDGLNGTSHNISIDEEHQKVIINKNGFVLKFGTKFYNVYDENDAELSFSSDDAANGAYVIKKSAFDAASGSNIDFSNIVYAAKGSEDYLNGLVLFHCYYGGLLQGGAFGSVIAFKQAVQDIKYNTFIPPYYTETLTAPSNDFIANINENNIDTFLFFTDPHLMGVSGAYKFNEVVDYISPIEKCYNRLPIDMVICGGDWLNSGDTAIQAKRKLGFVDAMMRKKFNKYYPMLGNHDVNDQTQGEGLSQGLLNNLLFRQEGSAYYYFNTRFAKWYVLDSGSIVSQALNLYRYEQIHWFANELLQNTEEHIVVCLHAYKQPGESSPFPFANNIKRILDAYNGETTITIWNPATQSDVTYNYTNAQGKVAVVLAGHAHYDDLEYTETDIPVVVTTWLRDNNTPSFDLDVIDWTLGKLKTVRVGTGSNREINIII